MRKDQKEKQLEADIRNQKSKPTYKAPKLIVHSGSDFVRKLGPAQACSPSPDFY